MFQAEQERRAGCFRQSRRGEQRVFQAEQERKPEGVSRRAGGEIKGCFRQSRRALMIIQSDSKYYSQIQRMQKEDMICV